MFHSIISTILSTSLIYIRQQINYTKQFSLSPKTFGTITPSSPWLCNRMMKFANLKTATTVAELGAGDGVLTKRLLNQLPHNAELHAWEIEPNLIRQLETLKNQDDRLRVIPESAEKLSQKYDIIFSCLPLLSLPLITRIRILRKIKKCLNRHGVCILFQYSRLSEKYIDKYFNWVRVYEIRNFPPAYVYICTPRSI